MTKTKIFTDLHVTYHEADNFTAGWTLDGARFHVWFNPDTLKLNGRTLYKNPLEGMNVGDAAFSIAAASTPTRP